MEILIIIGIFFLFVFIIFNLLQGKKTITQLDRLSKEIKSYARTCSSASKPSEDRSAVNVDSSGNDSESDSREEASRQTLLNIFNELGCNPALDENKNLSLSYQGENFLIMFNGAFLRIWDLSWFSIKPTDDSFPLFKDAINYANFSFGPTIVLHSPDENGNIIFSSRIDIPFFPDFKEPKGYIISMLDTFFGIKTSLHKEVNRLKDDPQDRTLHDNPIGFDTASLQDPLSPQAN